MSLSLILAILALVSVGLSFVPRFEVLHRVATLLLAVALIIIAAGVRVATGG